LFDFVPGDTNAVQKGELACYRQASDLASEITSDASARESVQKDRACKSWRKYEAGLNPSQLAAELRTRELQRLMWATLVVSLLTLVATIVLGAYG